MCRRVQVAVEHTLEIDPIGQTKFQSGIGGQVTYRASADVVRVRVVEEIAFILEMTRIDGEGRKRLRRTVWRKGAHLVIGSWIQQGVLAFVGCGRWSGLRWRGVIRGRGIGGMGELSWV